MSEETTTEVPTPPPSMESLEPGVRDFVEKHLQQQIGENIGGLKSKNSELLGKLKENEAKFEEMAAQLNKFTEAVGDRDPEDIKATLKQLESGEIEELFENKQYKEWHDIQLAKERQSWMSEFDGERQSLRSQIEENAAANAKLTELNKKLALDKESFTIFSATDGYRPGAARQVARDIRETFNDFDDSGEPISRDQFGDIVKNRQGDPLTLKYYIENDLREQSPFYWNDPVGGGGKGANGVSHNGFGSGITSKKGANAMVRSTFMSAARSAGKDPAEEWDRLPND